MNAPVDDPHVIVLPDAPARPAIGNGRTVRWHLPLRSTLQVGGKFISLLGRRNAPECRSSVGRQRLTVAEVRAMRKDARGRSDPKTADRLAARYSVSRRTVQEIIRRESWAWA